MRIVLLGVTLWMAGLGCAAARVRREAAPTLGCAADQIFLEERQHPKGTWVASGCGRLAICNLSTESDAEVTCAGGASVTYSPFGYEPSAPVAVLVPEMKSRAAIPAWIGERGTGARKSLARTHAKGR